MARDILKTLKSEHDDLRKLFKQMEETTDRARKSRAELLGDIETVTMTVHQPRLDSISHYTIKVKHLKMRREAVVRPAATLALSPDAYLSPSDTACRFCPAAGQCRARVEYMTKRDFGNPDLLSPEEIGKILHHAGFRVLEVSGSFELRNRFYGTESRQLLIVAEKRLPDAPI